MGQIDNDYFEREKRIKMGGNQEYLAKLKANGRMFARDRLQLLLDEGSFMEDGLFARCEDERFPADGVVTGIGTINGRTVCVLAQDASVKAGTLGRLTIEKMIRITEEAMKLKVPMIYLIDSAGARLDEQFYIFLGRRHAGKFFWMQSRLSGVVPQICLMFGPSPAGSAYAPGMADVVIMVDKNATAYLGSPRMSEMVTGEKVSLEDMGGAKMHCTISGLGDILVETEQEAIEAGKRYLSYFPQNWEEKTPLIPSVAPVEGPSLEEIIPQSQATPFDVRAVIERIVDAQSFMEFKELYAPELVTGFARLSGHSIGILANQSLEKGGVLFPDSSEKGAHFVELCNAFNIPLLFIGDISGFMIGSSVERAAIIRRGARFLKSVANTTVPKISLFIRKCSGAGYMAMGGSSYGPDACLALPQVKPMLMGPEAAVNAIWANKIAEMDEKERTKFVIQKRKEYLEDADVWKGASELHFDAVIANSQVRDELIKRFNYYCENRKPEDSEIKRRNLIYR